MELTLSTPVILSKWECRHAGRSTKQSLLKPVRILHISAREDSPFKEAAQIMVVQKGGKDAVAGSVLITWPSAACLSAASTILISQTAMDLALLEIHSHKEVALLATPLLSHCMSVLANAVIITELCLAAQREQQPQISRCRCWFMVRILTKVVSKEPQ